MTETSTANLTDWTDEALAEEVEYQTRQMRYCHTAVTLKRRKGQLAQVQAEQNRRIDNRR